MRISSFWRRVGDDAYEAVTQSADAPGMNRTVTYRRVASDVTISETRAPDGSHILVHEIEIDAPAADVWTAISTRRRAGGPGRCRAPGLPSPTSSRPAIR